MAKQTFESAMKRLEDVVRELESGDLGLDEALKKFEEGVKLSKFCSNKLEESEKKVSMLLRDAEGHIREEPLPDESSKQTPS